MPSKRLKKPGAVQTGCFNHRVVTLVADKPKRQWLCTIYFAVYTRQPVTTEHLCEGVTVNFTTFA